jgi:hypothetical protein
MLPPSILAVRNIRVAQRAPIHTGRWRLTIVPVDMRREAARHDGLPARRALFISALYLALVEEMLVQGRDLDHLLARLARDEERTRLPVVEIQLLLREGRILQAAELTFAGRKEKQTKREHMRNQIDLTLSSSAAHSTDL